MRLAHTLLYLGFMSPTRSLLFMLLAGSSALACSAAPDESVGQAEDQALSGRAACAFKRGDKPSKTLPSAKVPSGTVDKIVVLMQENRSFDHYFGQLNAYLAKKVRNDARLQAEYSGWHVDGAQASGQDDGKGGKLSGHHAPELCHADTNHEWYGAHEEFNGGKMNGFYQANQSFIEEGQPTVDAALINGERALWWYDERDIPFYYSLASTFGIGDHYFSSVMGPTWPNRDYLYAATSRGMTTNKRPNLTNLDFPAHDTVIFHELQRRKVDWQIFVDGALPAPRMATFLSPGTVFWHYMLAGRVHGMGDFYERARNGTLPEVSFLDANIHEDVDGNDEHPPGDIQNGQKFTSDIVHAMFGSPNWKDSVLFITYDENGGIYDHVVPPSACAPDEIAPEFSTDEDKAFDAANPGTGFGQLGFRVPVTVVSPFAKKGYVSHKTYDHTSITRFIETKFKMPALTARDANADAMLDFFDFENPPFMTPPNLAEPTIDQTRRETCQALYPKAGVSNQKE